MENGHLASITQRHCRMMSVDNPDSSVNDIVVCGLVLS